MANLDWHATYCNSCISSVISRGYMRTIKSLKHTVIHNMIASLQSHRQSLRELMLRPAYTWNCIDSSRASFLRNNAIEHGTQPNAKANSLVMCWKLLQQQVGLLWYCLPSRRSLLVSILHAGTKGPPQPPETRTPALLDRNDRRISTESTSPLPHHLWKDYSMIYERRGGRTYMQSSMSKG